MHDNVLTMCNLRQVQQMTQNDIEHKKVKQYKVKVTPYMLY